jgi:hypothetical protein
VRLRRGDDQELWELLEALGVVQPNPAYARSVTFHRGGGRSSGRRARKPVGLEAAVPDPCQNDQSWTVPSGHSRGAIGLVEPTVTG